MTEPNSEPRTVNPATASDERLLAEFVYAVDHWVPNMSPEAKKLAVDYVRVKAKVP